MPRWASQPHKHTGLVLAFLLILNKITHASIRAPVRMPPDPKDQKEQVSSTPITVAHNALLNHTPTGNSSDKN